MFVVFLHHGYVIKVRLYKENGIPAIHFLTTGRCIMLGLCFVAGRRAVQEGERCSVTHVLWLMGQFSVFNRVVMMHAHCLVFRHFGHAHCLQVFLRKGIHITVLRRYFYREGFILYGT